MVFPSDQDFLKYSSRNDNLKSDLSKLSQTNTLNSPRLLVGLNSTRESPGFNSIYEPIVDSIEEQ